VPAMPASRISNKRVSTIACRSLRSSRPPSSRTAPGLISRRSGELQFRRELSRQESLQKPSLVGRQNCPAARRESPSPAGRHPPGDTDEAERCIQIAFAIRRHRELDYASLGPRYSLLPRTPRARPLERLVADSSQRTNRQPARTSKSVPSPSIESALLGLAAIAKRRRQRGYELIS
jgi:hypothetical protein